MSSAATPTSQLVKFPDENEMGSYIKSHPLTLFNVHSHLYVANLFESATVYFANKEMPLDELSDRIEVFFKEQIDQKKNEPRPSRRKCAEAFKALAAAKLVPSSGFRIQIWGLPTSDPHFDYTLVACKKLLTDVLDKETYASPDSELGKKWMKEWKERNAEAIREAEKSDPKQEPSFQEKT